MKMLKNKLNRFDLINYHTLFPHCKKAKFKILFVLIIFGSTFSTAQVYNSHLNQSYNIKSPEISSLEKFIDIPADYNSGLPTTTIPIYTIKTKRMEIPLFLTYHHDGIKVEEAATNVGLGWNLIAGGAIIREARGLPDNKHFFDTGRRAIEDPTFTVSAPSLVSDPGDMNIVNEYLEEQWEEYKPDIFKVQAPMLDGGAFYFPAYGISFVHEQKPYSIQYSMGGSPGNPIDSFTLRSFQGVQYQFYTQETTINSPRGLTPSLNYTSAFKLSQMKDLLFNEIVDFQYSKSSGFTSYFVSSSSSAGPWVNNNCIESGTGTFSQDLVAGNTVCTQRLDAIYFPKGKVQFIYAPLPSDVSGSEEKLSRVEIYSLKGTTYSLVEAVNFKYSNFQTTTLAATWSTLNTGKGSNRLRLDSVQEEYNGVLKPPYLFRYNETPLPYYHSLARDHFGYFNGINNPSLIPYKSSNLGYEFSLHGDYSQTLTVGTQAVNRDSNFSSLMAGSLTEVVFPTGGKTRYTFEANMSESYAKKWGKRIQKIELLDADDSIYRSQIFTYHNSLQAQYNIDNLYDYYHTTQKAYHGNGLLETKLIGLSSPNVDISLDLPFFLNYFEEVSVKELNGAKTKYLYSVPRRNDIATIIPRIVASPVGTLFNGCQVWVLSGDPRNPQNTASFTFPKDGYKLYQMTNPYGGTPTGYSRFDGKLLRTEMYTNTDEKVYEEINDYKELFPLESKVLFEIGTSMVKPSPIYNGIVRANASDFYLGMDNHSTSYFVPLSSKTIREKRGGQWIESTEKFEYKGVSQLSNIKKTASSGDETQTKYFYTGDKPDPNCVPVYGSGGVSGCDFFDTVLGDAKGIAVAQEFYDKGVFLSQEWTHYTTVGYMKCPASVSTKKQGMTTYDDREYYTYDNSSGNLTEVRKGVGPDSDYTSFVYGYNKQYLVAIVKGASAAAIQGLGLAQNILDNPSSDTALLTELNRLRTELPNTQVTTYTQLPLVGVSSITDPKGNKQTFNYDSFGRLQYVKDKDGNILSENEYHYKAQN